MFFFFLVVLVNFAMCVLCLFPLKRKEISPSSLLSTSLPVAPIEPPLHLCCFNSGWPDTLMTWRQTAWCYLWQVMQRSCCWGNNTRSARNFWTGSAEINGKLCRSWRDRKSAVTLVGTHTHTHTHTNTRAQSQKHLYVHVWRHWHTIQDNVWPQHLAPPYPSPQTPPNTHMSQTHTHSSDHNTGDWVIGAGLGLDVEKKGWLQTLSRWWSMALRSQGRRKTE